MFKRTLEKELIVWKNSSPRKPLVLRGARQVGKTSLIRQFGTTHYQSFLEINLEKKDDLSYFNSSQSVEDFLDRLQNYHHVQINPTNTLIFIDEIQESQNIMELLRFFYELRPDLHIIVAGSLLEAKIKSSNWSLPVGRVTNKYLYPLTFFEYLWAVDQPLPPQTLTSAKHEFYSNLFKDYLLVGGMPEAVAAFSHAHKYLDVKNVLEDLQITFMDDVHKYARHIDQQKYLELILSEGPKAAGTVFRYDGFGGSTYKSREISAGFTTIENTLLLHQVKSLNSTVLPLTPKLNRAKKLLWLDMGIVNHANNVSKELITTSYQGRLMEQCVGQTLLSIGIKDLFFWARDRDEGSAEVDFCFQLNDKVIVIEVKSGNSQQMKSLFSLADIDPSVTLVRISWDPLGLESHHHGEKNYKILSVPFYLVDRIMELI